MVVGERLKAALEEYTSSLSDAVVMRGSLRRSTTIRSSTHVDISAANVFVGTGKALRPRRLAKLVNSSIAASGIGRRGLLQLLTDGSTSSDTLGADLDGPADVVRWSRLVARLARSVSPVRAASVAAAALPNWALRVRTLWDDSCRSVSREVAGQRESSCLGRTAWATQLARRARGIVTHVEQLLRVSWQLLLTGRRSDSGRQSRIALLGRLRHRDTAPQESFPGELVASSGRTPRGPDSQRLTLDSVIRGELLTAA